jgi:hypothetical protein
MPSRTRIVLRRNDRPDLGPGECIKNEAAKKWLISLLGEDILWKTGLPEGWAKLKLRGKLEYLKTLLPPEWVLEVYTEPRATRPTRSVYKSQFVKEGRRKKAPRGGLVGGAIARWRDEEGPYHDEPAPVDPQPPQNQQTYNIAHEWIATPPAQGVRIDENGFWHVAPPTTRRP